VKVLIVDDHPLFCEGMKNFFLAHGNYVVDTAANGLVALEKARTFRPDVVLMDINMEGCNGFLSTRLIKSEMPEIKIVMLTASDKEEDLFEAVHSGACGYLLKNLEAQELFDLFAVLEQDEPPLAPGLAMKILKKLANKRDTNQEVSAVTVESGILTPRQIAILSLVAKGYTYQQVAEAVCFSERTVKYEIKEILKRLQLQTRSEAIAYATSNGLIGG